MRREIDDRELPSRLQRAKQARVELQGLRQMMVNAPQENRIATRFGQACGGLSALNDRDVLQISFLDFGPKRLEFLLVNLRGEHFSRRAYMLKGGKCVAPISGSNVRYHCPRFPLHERRELRNFIRRGRFCAQRQGESCHCRTTERKQKPSLRFDLSIHGEFSRSLNEDRAFRNSDSLLAD